MRCDLDASALTANEAAHVFLGIGFRAYGDDLVGDQTVFAFAGIFVDADARRIPQTGGLHLEPVAAPGRESLHDRAVPTGNRQRLIVFGEILKQLFYY